MSQDTLFICGATPRKTVYSFGEISQFIDAIGLGNADMWYSTSHAEDWRVENDDETGEVKTGKNFPTDFESLSSEFSSLTNQGVWSLTWYDAIPKALRDIASVNTELFDDWCPVDLDLVVGPQVIMDGWNEAVCFEGPVSLRLGGGGSPGNFDEVLRLLAIKFIETELFKHFENSFGKPAKLCITCR